jgi:hypothetical protein
MEVDLTEHTDGDGVKKRNLSNGMPKDCTQSGSASPLPGM